MPTDWTVDELRKLQKRGRPVDYMIYPDADHGIMRFETMPNGERRVLGYEPDYFKVQIDWLKRASSQSASAAAMAGLPESRTGRMAGTTDPRIRDAFRNLNEVVSDTLSVPSVAADRQTDPPADSPSFTNFSHIA